MSRPGIVWLTGLPGAGKTTIADAVQLELGKSAYVLDGDRLRSRLNRDLGFTASERMENVRRVAEVARLFADAGVIAIVAVVSPLRADRLVARQVAGDIPFIEVHVYAPLAVCETRDPKGLYRDARAGSLDGLTGVDAPYEAPDKPDVLLDTSILSRDESVARLIAAMCDRGLVQPPH